LWEPRPDSLVLRFARRAAAALRAYHRATLDGIEHLPTGPALIVGNHGTLGFETPVFFYLLHTVTGRYPAGLADRTMFGRWPIRPLVERVGGVVGTRESARRLLGEGHLVVCYPGGVREVFKGPRGKHRLAWDGATGFARVAIEAQVPVLPFAGVGIDDAYVNLGHPLGRVLGRYTAPLAVGPLPARFRFRLGAPLAPPRGIEEAVGFKQTVQDAVEALLGADAPPRLPEVQAA
jgi:1-acyl-sn-glycerol-3-phosphate acyltransferase